MYMDLRSAEATHEWHGRQKKSHDLKDLPLLTLTYYFFQPFLFIYVVWMLYKCGLALSKWTW